MTTLLYPEDHNACKNHIPNLNTAVRNLRIEKDKRLNIELTNARIALLISGSLEIFYMNSPSATAVKRKIMFFPPGSRILVKALEDSHVLECSVNDDIKLCEEYSPENLYWGKTDAVAEFHPLDFNEKIDMYLNSFLPYLEDGIKCLPFLNMKIMELFFLLRLYYPKEDLHKFFSPLLSKDMKFSKMVWSNYRKASSVAELAGFCNYSISRFKGKFKETFGVPALSWLNAQRAQNIYFDLRHTDKSLIDISEEYHFASPSYLSTFCKKNLTLPPTKIRRSNKEMNF